MEIGEIRYEKVCMSPRPPPKISLKHERKRELGSEIVRQPEVGQLSGSFLSNQPIPNPWENGETRCTQWRFMSRANNVDEVNVVFRIPGIPHSVLKQAESSRVRELVKMIENHPDLHALQQDLRHNQAYDPFSPESKKMIQEWTTSNGNCLNCSRRIPKRGATARLSSWNVGILYYTCGHILQKGTEVNRKC